MPIDHCVFFKRSATASTADLQSVMDDLAAIVERLNGASDFRAGANISPEGHHKGYLDGFIIRFDDAAARDAYLVDEEHKAAGAKLVSLIEGGVAGLLVFDLVAE